MAIRLIKPPIRTALMNNPDGTPMTQASPANGSGSASGAANGSPDAGQLTIQKHWYRYWGDCGDQINANTDKLDNLVTFGTHASRPDPANMPSGALYVESDRLVIYSNIDGAWHYVAGTMWGTLSPDQRPTDLGVNDAGFDFRTTDDPAREFIWSQAQWIEATPVRYGTHAARLAVNVATVIDQMLWVETDRGAIYQLQLSGSAHVWQYLAGTMWGTLSPDQRPTDLGTHDAGFDFRGTDQQREFIWSQTAWIEVTPVAGGAGLTHANVVTKVGSAGQIVEGGITDLSAGNSQKITILASGLVGIGNSSPDVTLSVAAASSPFAFSLRYAAGGTPFYIGVNSAGGLQISNGSGNQVMVIGQNGSILFQTLPGANPGAGSKQIWYDPADSNRVKFSA